MKSLCLLVAIGLLSSPTHASPLPTLPVDQLIVLCSDPTSSPSVKADAASELTFRDNLKLDGDQLAIALACLKSEFSSDFTYNGFSLFSPEFDAAAADTNRAQRDIKEKLAQDRAEAFTAELTLLCHAELEKDRFRAMTTDACARIFIRDGLPD